MEKIWSWIANATFSCFSCSLVSSGFGCCAARSSNFLLFTRLSGDHTYTGHPKNQKPLLFTPIDRYHPIPSPCIPTFGPPLRSIQLSPPYPPQSPSRCPRRTRCRAPRAPVYWSCRARAGSVSWRPRGRPRWCRGGCPRRWCRLRNYTGGVLCAWLV